MTEKIEESSRTKFGLWLAAISLGALAILAMFPARFPSDGDESFQIGIVRAPFSAIWSAVRRDRFHPPLDYLIDGALERILPGICERRVPAMIWGALAVAVFGLAVKRVAGPRAALAASILLATSPAFVAESRRLRPYSLGLFALLFAFLMLLRLVASPTWPKAAAFMASAVFAAWSLDLAALFVVVTTLLVVVNEVSSGDPVRRSRAVVASGRAAALALPGLAACVPLIPFLQDAMSHELVGAAPRLSLGRTIRVVSYAFVSPAAGYRFPPRVIFALAVATAAAGLLAGTIIGLKDSRWRVFPVWAGTGYVLMEALQRFHPEYDSFRYFLPLVPAMVATLAIAWSELYRRRRAVSFALLVVFLGMTGRSLVRYYRYGQWNFCSGRDERERSGAGILPRRNSPGGEPTHGQS